MSPVQHCKWLVQSGTWLPILPCVLYKQQKEHRPGDDQVGRPVIVGPALVDQTAAGHALVVIQYHYPRQSIADSAAVGATPLPPTRRRIANRGCNRPTPRPCLTF